MFDPKSIYEEVYSTLPDYGTVNHGGYVQNHIIHFLKPNSIVDIGCGKGQFCLFMNSKNIKCIGVDIAAPFPNNNDIIWLKENFKKLSLSDNAVEWASAFDVLEHIQEKELNIVFEEIKRVAFIGAVFTICFRDSVYNFKGYSLHQIVKSSKWWKAKLSEIGNVEEFDIQPTFGIYIIRF